MEKIKLTQEQYNVISDYYNRDANMRMSCVLQKIALDFLMDVPIEDIKKEVLQLARDMGTYLSEPFEYNITDIFEIYEKS